MQLFATSVDIIILNILIYFGSNAWSGYVMVVVNNISRDDNFISIQYHLVYLDWDFTWFVQNQSK